MDEVSPLTPRKYHKFQDAIRDLRFNPVTTYRFTGQLILETIKVSSQYNLQHSFDLAISFYPLLPHWLDISSY